MLQINNSSAFLELVNFLHKSDTKPPAENLSIIIGEKNYQKLKQDNLVKKKNDQINPIDTIVTEPLFSSLLNSNGEIRVENTIYRITPYGTFMFLPDKKEFVDSLILKLESISYKSMQHISEIEKEPYLYEIQEGVYRYDTFVEMEDKLVEYETSVSTPINNTNSDDFQVHTIVNKHTIVGKFLQDAFGFSASYERYFRDDRRVKLKFSSPNFILFSYIKIKVEMQKKNWIGWSGTSCEELSLGWDGIKYIFNHPVTMNPIPTRQNDPSTWRYGKMTPPGSKKEYLVIEISDYTITLTSKEVAKIFKASFDWVRGKLSPNTNKEYISVITKPTEINVSSESFTVYNSESISKTLDFSVGLFTFKWDMNSSVSGSNFTVKPMGFKIKSASIFGMAKFNGKTLGIRIEKL